MNLLLFGVAGMLFLTADIAGMTAGVRRKKPRIRFYTYGVMLVQILGSLAGAWYFSSDAYTHTSWGYRDGFFETLLCLAAAGIYVISLLICTAVGYARRVYEITEK